jgi:hypothetical protein
MKYAVIKSSYLCLLMVTAVAVYAVSLDVKMQSFNGPPKGQGKPTWRMKIFTRGDSRILTERVSVKNTLTRTYTVKGITMSEIDDNNDGAWDTLVFYDADGNVVEGFERLTNNVTPVSTEKLMEWRKDSGRWKEYWDSALPKKTGQD